MSLSPKVTALSLGALVAALFFATRFEAMPPVKTPAHPPVGAHAHAPAHPAPATRPASKPADKPAHAQPAHKQPASKTEPKAAPAPAGKAAATPATPPAAVHNTEPFAHFKVGDRNVKALMIEGDTVWIGSSGGVIRYDDRSQAHSIFDNRNGLLANGVFSVGRVNGRLAVGTYGGGLALRVGETDRFDIINVPDGLADAFVYDVETDRNGDVWVATWSGANRVKGGRFNDPKAWETFTVEHTKGGLPNDWVYGLANGRNGEMWFATEGGLARFHNGKWTSWKHADGLGAPYDKVKHQIEFTNDPAKVSEHHARQKVEMGLQNVNVAYNPNYIVALLVDRDGIVWAGTWGGGLSRFDGKTWKVYTQDDGLPANHVFALHQDGQGRIWAGTSHGLALRQGERFRAFTTADGLYSNAVFSMATASDGTMWVGSFGGVARLSRLP